MNRYAFDRSCELEADAYAVKLLHDSGLDPGVLLTYLRTLPMPQEQTMSVYPQPQGQRQARKRPSPVSGR